MPFVLKVAYLNDTRRVTLENPPNFAELVATIKSLVPNLPSPEFAIKYLDEDEDAVTISTDLELLEAIRATKGSNILRLTIQPKSSQPTSTATRGTGSSSVFDPLAALPEISAFLTKTLNGSQRAEAFPDLVNLFQNLGINTTTTSTTSTTTTGTSNLNPPQQQLQQILAQVEKFIRKTVPPDLLQNFAPELVKLLPQLFSSAPVNTPASTSSSPMVSSPVSDRKEEEKPKPEIHYGVICDICEGPINGVRYKCSSCYDFDLCESCESKPNSHDPTHILLKIQKPTNFGFGTGRGCPYMRPENPNNINNNSVCSNRPWNRGSRKTAQQSGFLARFVSDVTVPDGITLAPGQNFVKIWRLRNEGQIPWPEGACLEYVGGDKLSKSNSVMVPAVLPSEEIDIAVEMTSPVKPGRYVSFWKLCHVDGSRFGQRVWVDIFVLESNSAAEAPQSSQSTQTAANLSMEVETQTQLATESKSIETTSIASSTVGTNTPLQPAGLAKDLPAQLVQLPPLENITVSPEVQQLLDMGFQDSVRIQALLNQNGNDLVQTVQDLLTM